jgi:hypothetical protein
MGRRIARAVVAAAFVGLAVSVTGLQDAAQAINLHWPVGT